MTTESNSKLYIITPTPLMEWMQTYKDENITNRPDLIEFIHSKDLNAEDFYYYQK
jgi:hypothetical protein